MNYPENGTEHEDVVLGLMKSNLHLNRIIAQLYGDLRDARRLAPYNHAKVKAFLIEAVDRANEALGFESIEPEPDPEE